MKKALIATSILFFSLVALSQNTADNPIQKGNGKITGTVTDAATRQPVEFANVVLNNPKTGKPVDGTVCDDKGKFVVHKVAPGTYTVVISFIGYETQTIQNITLTDKHADINLGNISLNVSIKMLGEVTVEAEKTLIEERVDRTIYNAENDKTTAGGDATDVLKRVPMLSVDLDGNVSMRGSSNIQVLINNKPSTIMASSVADALKQIPADQIKSVEVITSPSAKYDAEGSAGIINIITKKNTLQGLTLGIDAGVGIRGSNLGLNGNYRTKKMGFSLGGFGRANYNIHGRFENDQTTLDSLTDLIPTINTQRANTRNSGLHGHYTLGWDYDINEKNFITASARFGARNFISYQDDLFSEIRNEAGTSSTLRNVETEDLSNTLDISLNYTHQYEKPQREFSILGNYSRNNRNNNFENRIRQVSGVNDPSGFKNLNDSYNQEITVQADYQTPVNTNQMLEFGGKDIMRNVFSDYTYFEDADGDGNYTPSNNTTLSNNLNYDQNIVAGYLSYTYSTKNSYSIKAGARYEYTTIKAYTQTEANIDIPEYGAFVPSVNISKKLKSGNTVKAAYNRRIQRPSIRFLNPNIQASNPYDISYGNPNLDPEYSNNFELSYSTLIKKTSVNISTFWRNTNNAIQSLRSVETVNDVQRVSTTYQNIGQEDAVGVNIFANVNIGKLTLNGGADIYYAMLDNNLPVDANNPDDPNRQYSAHNEGWVSSGRLFGSYNLSKGWGFQFFGFYRGRQIQLQGTQGGMGIYSLGLKKDFNNKKGSFGLAAENFLTNGMTIRSNISSPLVNRESVSVLHNMGLRATFSYRIGKMSVDAKPRRRKSINNDDLKDGGGDGGGMDMSAQPQGQSMRNGNAAVMPTMTKANAFSKLPKGDSLAVVIIEGNWRYTVETPQGTNGGTLTIKKDGETYSGIIVNSRMNRETPLKTITVTGNALNFSYETNMGGTPSTIDVKAIVTGSTFSGTMNGRFGAMPISGQLEQ